MTDRLPPAPIAAVPMPTTPAAGGAGETRPKLLVVDDQPANIRVLHSLFGDDHQVLMATSGAQALRLAESARPDVVLLDVEMPGMGGLEVCRRLRESEATRDIPVIFVSAHHGIDDETGGFDAGAVDFISKPIQPRIVRARVRTQLTLKRQADLLRRWVYLDGLTGVANRRHFDEQLDAEWRRHARDAAPLSLAMIDVDHFKRYNDRHGHQAGDDCLRAVAAALKDAGRRPGDLLARFGGEEFALLLPATDADGARHVGDALVDAVRRAAIAHGACDALPVVTVSVGLTTARPSAEPDAGPASLIRAADAQLYRAKAAGRDRASAAPAEPPHTRLAAA